MTRTRDPYTGPEYKVGDRVRTNSRSLMYREPVEFTITAVVREKDPIRRETLGKNWYKGDPHNFGIRSAFIELVTPAPTPDKAQEAAWKARGHKFCSREQFNWIWNAAIQSTETFIGDLPPEHRREEAAHILARQYGLTPVKALAAVDAVTPGIRASVIDELRALPRDKASNDAWADALERQ